VAAARPDRGLVDNGSSEGGPVTIGAVSVSADSVKTTGSGTSSVWVSTAGSGPAPWINMLVSNSCATPVAGVPLSLLRFRDRDLLPSSDRFSDRTDDARR